MFLVMNSSLEYVLAEVGAYRLYIWLYSLSTFWTTLLAV